MYYWQEISHGFIVLNIFIHCHLQSVKFCPHYGTVQDGLFSSIRSSNNEMSIFNYYFDKVACIGHCLNKIYNITLGK